MAEFEMSVATVTLMLDAGAASNPAMSLEQSLSLRFNDALPALPLVDEADVGCPAGDE